jgi:hypothetical protein
MRESDWMQMLATDGIPEKQKIIKDCTSLQISETAYTFTTTRDIRHKFGFEVPEPNSFPSLRQPPHKWRMQSWSEGQLNRTTGEFFASQTIDDGLRTTSIMTTTWKMTCVPTQEKK